MDFTNDEILVREIKKCSDRAFRFLIDNYLPSIVSVLMRRSNLPYYEAVDIANDAIVNGFMKIGQYDSQKGSKLFSWITRIAINSAINKTERRKSVETVPLEYDPESREDVNIEPLHRTEEIQLQIVFHNAVDRLSRTDRQMIELFLEGLTDKKIAERLDIKYDAARQRKKRARQKLKDILLSSSLFKKMYLKENHKEEK